MYVSHSLVGLFVHTHTHEHTHTHTHAHTHAHTPTHPHTPHMHTPPHTHPHLPTYTHTHPHNPHPHPHTHRYHKVGLLVLFVHDIGDVFLELSKTLFYFKDRGGKEYWWPEMVATICFAMFTIQQ